MSQSSVTPLRPKAAPKAPAKKHAGKRDLELLHTAWTHEKSRREISLKDMATHFEINYETVRSTYKGTRSLAKPLWKMRFACYLDKYPQDIWPDWEFKHMTMGALPPQLNLFALKAQMLSPQARRILLIALDQLSDGTLAPESMLIVSKANTIGPDTRKMLLAQLDHWHKLETKKPKSVPPDVKG